MASGRVSWTRVKMEQYALSVCCLILVRAGTRGCTCLHACLPVRPSVSLSVHLPGYQDFLSSGLWLGSSDNVCVHSCACVCVRVYARARAPHLIAGWDKYHYKHVSFPRVHIRHHYRYSIHYITNTHFNSRISSYTLQAAVFTHSHVCPPGRRVNRHQPPGPLTMGGHKRKLDVKGHGTPATSHVTSNGSNGIQYGQASWRKKYSFQGKHI